MTLNDYLIATGTSLSAFARAIGAKNARTVQRYTKHGRIPSGQMMARISAATEGQVQAGDFFDVPPLNASADPE
jgi:hypothetical protein